MIAAASLIFAASLALGFGVARHSSATDPPAAEQASLIEILPASPPTVTIEAELTDSSVKAQPPVDPQEQPTTIVEPVTIDESPTTETPRPATKATAPRKRKLEEQQPAPAERLLVQPEDL